MTTRPRPVNRGPAAAAENRRAILAAARRLFAEQGYAVPMSAVARAAGIGQGVLYRHFPSRFDLAFAVFEDNLAELEAIAAEPGPQAFGRLWSRLLDMTVEVSAFVELIVEARRSAPHYPGDERLRALIDTTLPRAQGAGLVDPGLTTEDVLLAWRMAFGVVVTAVGEHGEVRDQVDRALRLAAGVPRPGDRV